MAEQVQEEVKKSDPMRGFSSFKWQDRAKNPNTPVLKIKDKDATLQTMSSQVDGKEWLYPSIRMQEDGTLLQLSPTDALQRAKEEDDYLEFDTPEEATLWSKQFSDEVDKARGPKLEQKPAPPLDPNTPEIPPSPASLPSEASKKYENMLEYMTLISKAPDSGDKAHQLITMIEKKLAEFDPNGGPLAGLEVGHSYDKPVIDPSQQPYQELVDDRRSGLKETNLLKEFEQRFPINEDTPGSILIKSYLKEKINDVNRPTLYKGPVGMVDTAVWFGKESAKAIDDAFIDLVHVTNRIGWDAMQGILSFGGLLMSEPVRQIAKIGTGSDLEAEEFAKKVFSLSTYGLDKTYSQTPTLTGQIAEPLGQVASAIYSGGKMLGWAGDFFRKWLPEIGHSLNTYRAGHAYGSKYFDRAIAASKDPLFFTGVKEMVGAPLFVTPENRLAAFLKDMGADDPMTTWIVGSKDDSEAMERFKTFIDGGFAGVGMGSAFPAFAMAFRSLFNMGRPVAYEAFEVGSSFWTKVEKFFPKNVDKRKTQVKETYVDADGKKQTRIVSLKDPNAPTSSKLEDVQKVKAAAKKEIERTLKDNPKSGVSLKKELRKRGYEINKDGMMVMIPKVKSTLVKKKFKKGEKENLIKSIISDPNSTDFHNSQQSIFNVDRFSSKEDVKEAINQAAVMIEGTFKKGKKTNKQLLEDARRIDDEIESWVGAENKAKYYQTFAGTTDATPAVAAALRQYLFEESRHFVNASKKLNDILDSGVDPTSQEWVDYYLDIYKFLHVMESDIKVAGNIARTLQNRRAILSAPENVLQNVIAGAKDSGSTGKEVLRELAKNIGKAEDPLQLQNQIKRHSSQYHLFEGAKQTAVNGLLSNVMTQAATSFGILAWKVQNGLETYTAAGLNTIGKKFSKYLDSQSKLGRASATIFGTGEGMTFNAANAQSFGRMQALLEVFVGRGHFTMDRGAISSALQAGKSLEVASVADDFHELTDVFKGDRRGAKLTIGNTRIEIGSGINENMVKDFFGEDSGIMKSQAGELMKMFFNSAGLVNSAAGRAIMMQDAFYRNVLERGEIHRLSMLRAESIERSLMKESGKEISAKQMNENIMKRYIQVVDNLPEDIAQEAASIAKMGLMQESPGRIVGGLERGKNHTFDWGGADANLLQQGVSAIGNIGTTYLTSKFSFIRTMTNIFKQSLWERGPLVPLRIGLSPKQKELWATSEAFRQESVAKLGTGSLMMYLGYALGSKLNNAGYEYDMNIEGLTSSLYPSSEDIAERTKPEGDTVIYMEGIDAGDPKQTYIRQAQGLQSPEILVKDLNTGKLVSYPLARLDLQKAPLVLGSIIGSYYEQLREADNLEYIDADGNLMKDFDEDIWEERKKIHHKALYALGNWMVDIPMAKGIKDMLHNFIPGFSATGRMDPSKEVTNFLAEFLNPTNSFYSSFRKGVHKATDRGSIRRFSDQQEESYYEPSQTDEKGNIIQNTRTDLNVPFGEIRPKIGKEKNLFSVRKGDTFYELIMAVESLREAAENRSIMDITNVEFPKVGQSMFAMVDPEGNLMKHLPDTARNKLERGLKTLAIPWTPKTAVRSNTLDLIVGLQVPYDHPFKWTIPSPKKGGATSKKKIVLSAEQRFEWMVHAGRLNKDVFNQPQWKKLIHDLNTGAMGHPLMRMKKSIMAKTVENIIRENRIAAFNMMQGNPRNVDLNIQMQLQNEVDNIKKQG